MPGDRAAPLMKITLVGSVPPVNIKVGPVPTNLTVCLACNVTMWTTGGDRKYLLDQWDPSHYTAPMTDLEKFAAEIEAFLKRVGMSPSEFGLRAMNDAKFVGRIREGSDVLMGTASRVRKFMAEYRPSDFPRHRATEARAVA